MSEPTNGGPKSPHQESKTEDGRKRSQHEHDEDEGSSQSGSDSGSSSDSGSGSESQSDKQEDKQERGSYPQPPQEQEMNWKPFDCSTLNKPAETKQEDKMSRGNNIGGNNIGDNESTFQNFNPKFTAGEDEEEEEEFTRDEYRNPGRGGGRGGRGGRGGGDGFGRGGRGGGFGGGFDRGDRGFDRGFDRGDRGGRGGRGGGRGGGFGDRGFGDRGGRGGRGGGRGGGSFGGRDRDDSFGNREFGFGNRDNNSSSSYGNRDNNSSSSYGNRDNNSSGFGNRGFNNGQQNTQSFQAQSELRGSHSSNNQSSVPQSQFSQVPQAPQQFQAMIPGQVPPGNFPVNYIPYIAASDPQSAFKKKAGYLEEEKLSSSKVSKVSKAPSKASKRDKKKKRKHSSSSDSSSSSNSDSSDDEGNQSLNMSLCQAALDNDSSIIHALDDLKRKQKQKRNDKKRYEKLSPEGRKDWPHAGLYVLGNILEITYRNITQHSDCVMVIPYEDTSMSLYPGTIVNKGQIDYREKLEAKNETLKPGSVYTQDNYLSREFLYHCIAFVKIDKEPETVENGLKYIFETLEKLQKKFKHLKNLVIPLSMFTHHPDKYPQFIKKVANLMESKKFKSVYLTTKSEEEFQRGMEAFTVLTAEMMKRKEIGT